MAPNPALEARLQQTSTGYRADTWLNVELEAMTKLWQGIGGQSSFFFSEEDARQSRGAYAGSTPYRIAQTLWRLAQVEPNVKLGFRQGIREFVVDLRTPAAVGLCRANPHLGSGSVFQYFVPNWARTLRATGREFQFSRAGY